MNRELEDLLEAYDAFKQTPEGPELPGYMPFMKPSWLMLPNAPIRTRRRSTMR